MAAFVHVIWVWIPYVVWTARWALFGISSRTILIMGQSTTVKLPRKSPTSSELSSEGNWFFGRLFVLVTTLMMLILYARFLASEILRDYWLSGVR
jgi:hypothetical protein